MKLDANHRVMARYRVNQIPFTIGRSTNNDLVLDDLCVARNHCRIVEKDGRYILEDVGTMNKLYVNGMMTSQVPLSDGVRVYIGNEEFQIEVEGRRSQSTRLYKTWRVFMSRHDTGTKSFSFERVLWEIQRAFYSFKNSPVLALLLMQAAAFIFVQAKGAGKIYLDMIGILLGITLLSWIFYVSDPWK